ncbi:hypothetical protein OAO87_03570 [bacterium]|nr:hypothetical protein [bacterium]
MTRDWSCPPGELYNDRRVQRCHCWLFFWCDIARRGKHIPRGLVAPPDTARAGEGWAAHHFERRWCAAAPRGTHGVTSEAERRCCGAERWAPASEVTSHMRVVGQTIVGLPRRVCIAGLTLPFIATSSDSVCVGLKPRLALRAPPPTPDYPPLSSRAGIAPPPSLPLQPSPASPPVPPPDAPLFPPCAGCGCAAPVPSLHPTCGSSPHLRVPFSLRGGLVW